MNCRIEYTHKAAFHGTFDFNVHMLAFYFASMCPSWIQILNKMVILLKSYLLFVHSSEFHVTNYEK